MHCSNSITDITSGKYGGGLHGREVRINEQIITTVIMMMVISLVEM